MNDHLVQFYEDDVFLIKGLSDYIGDALERGDKGIAIATSGHLDMLHQSLHARGLVDAQGRSAEGNYLALQADHMLPMFMDNGLPDEQRFRNAIGNVIRQASERHQGRVCVFGEMVAILCASSHCSLNAVGKHDAAIRVERFFNNLQRQFDFELLCAYPLNAFPAAADAPMFDEVCTLHTHVLPAESYDPSASVQTLQRTIAALQQQAYSLSTEVHDRRLIEQALREVNIDRLTGLPNRNVFQDRLEMDIKKAHRSGLPLALLFIDLDHFKEINDTLGHQVGDMLLKQVGQRLQTYVRESDTVARLGGDEFTITLSELHNVDTVTDVAQKIRNDLAKPFLLGNELAYISASIGITLYPRDAQTAGELLRNADQAMYQSKDNGRNRFTYFTASMQEAAQARMAISNELRRAIDEDQLAVYFQPIIDMKNGHIRKAEALVRWLHPLRGAVSPVDFIPIAEHTGQIVTIGNWVFRQALAHARRWRRFDQQLTVNINVSPAQFYHTNGENCRHWLSDLSFAPNGATGPPEVGIEITEGLLLASNSAVMKQLLAFQQAGITISLDDFGTGYSSLSYLRKFNLDYLKIDKSFVYNLEHDAANVALCEAIIVMAHKLGLKVIAEGVETAQQYEMLRRAGCDYGQGFLFGEPLPPDQFEALLQERPMLSA
ncbi:EAL domain-containing protein [Massilia violaceinigra]|uniref:EAL domain-containing protein n=1 Tax=Massilia violaceinigra TaxID=2045208 RepID=A0ABY4AEQ2_9BURK|nr:EAL domain-containing protein [Massilia violaceinigra]UOD32872.1 EAL domain-containing protein [Massilia violaceinigra]